MSVPCRDNGQVTFLRIFHGRPSRLSEGCQLSDERLKLRLIGGWVMFLRSPFQPLHVDQCNDVFSGYSLSLPLNVWLRCEFPFIRKQVGPQRRAVVVDFGHFLFEFDYCRLQARYDDTPETVPPPPPKLLDHISRISSGIRKFMSYQRVGNRKSIECRDSLRDIGWRYSRVISRSLHIWLSRLCTVRTLTPSRAWISSRRCSPR